jgi:hypothetical protein
MMEKFAPHRSLATYHVWASLVGQVVNLRPIGNRPAEERSK